METKNVIEGNKLIAEFMGAKFINEYKFVMDEMERDRGILKYHTSWDWLMPVVEKIESQLFQHQYIVEISDCQCKVLRYNDNEEMFIPHSKTTKSNKIMATWSEIVYFIKWYNLSK